jgi:guanylate cyclase
VDATDRRGFPQLAQAELDDALSHYANFVLSLSAVAQQFGSYLTVDAISPNIPIPLCKNGQKVIEVNFSLTSVVVAQTSNIGRLLLPSHNWTDSYQDNAYFCSAVNSMRPFAEAMQRAQERLFDDYIASFTKYSSAFSYAAASVPFALILLTYAFAPICAVLYLKELQRLYGSVMSHDDAQRIEASRPLGNQYIYSGKAYIPPVSSSITFVHVYSLLLFLVFSIEIAVAVVALLGGRNAAEEIAMLERFGHASNTQLPQTTEAAVHLYNAWLGKGTNSLMIDPNAEFDRVAYLSEKIDNMTVDMQTASTGGGSIMGVDSQLDDLVLSTDCHLSDTPSALHDLYNCSYTTHLFIVFQRLVREVQQDMKECNGIISGIPLTTLHHLVTKHFTHQHHLMSSRLTDLVANAIQNFKLTLTLSCVAGMLVACVFFFVLQLFHRELSDICESALNLIKRIAPQMIAGNTAFLDWLGWRNADADRHALTPEQSVLHVSQDGILCVTRDLVIEYLNPAITQFLGYSPEQKLGCSLATMLTPQSAEQMETLVKQLGEEPTVVVKVDCIAESGEEFACQAVCFPLKQDRTSERCVIVLSDIRDLENMRLAVEAAREETTRLANAVMPPELMQRADSGELAFVVPSASVMTLSLGKFDLEHASPQEVMPKLTQIFLIFEQRMLEFPLITKVRVFGESFLCAAGLFGGELGEAVEQIVTFGQNCIEILEDVNVKNYAQHTVQIGITTGGPIICGIIGEDRAAFDIFGTVVNMSTILQKTAPLNSFQLGDSTFQLVDSSGYHATKRVLKVAGREYLTHLVRLASSSSGA